MLTRVQNDDFTRDLLPSDPLDTAVEWISSNLDPGDVFTHDTLAKYVKDNLDIGDVFSTDEIIAYVRDHCEPEEVFPSTVLGDWAETNGFEEAL